jgi:AraC-like DNA-binding protein
MFIGVYSNTCATAHLVSVFVCVAIAMDAKRHLIIDLHKRGFRNIDIFRKLQNINICKKLIDRTIKRFKELGTVDIQKKTGRKRSVRTKNLIRNVKDKIRRNRGRSARKLAQEHNVSRSTMRRVLKDDLGMTPFKKRRGHGLTIKNKQDRMARCKKLLRRRATSKIVFSDEKLFLLQPSLNAQNDRLYAVSIVDIPEDEKTVERFQNVSKVMVWGAFSADRKFPLVFIDEGVKINAEVYKQKILHQNLLPQSRILFQDEPWVFQQDGAPSHKANTTQEWCRSNLPDFIDRDSWPPSSPDLNPLDYFAWGYMESKLNDLKIKQTTTITTFKKKIEKIWNDIPMDMVRAACNSFRKRLRLVIKENGNRIHPKG